MAEYGTGQRIQIVGQNFPLYRQTSAFPPGDTTDSGVNSEQL